MMKQLNVRKHLKEILGFLRNGDCKETESGLLVHGCIQGRGMYVHTVNGEDEQVDYNLIPAEGIAHILNTCFFTESKVSAWYLAPYSSVYTPTSTLTAATFDNLAVELGGAPEGYSEALRRTWVTATSSAGKVGNLASRATFTIVTASTININGAGLLSSNVKQGTAGKIASATKFGSARVLNNTDTFELGYEVELTDS